MDQNKILFDTNIILYFLNGNIHAQQIVRNSIPYVSFITYIELLSSPKISKSEEKAIYHILEYITVIDYNIQIGKIAVDLRRKHKLQIADAIIGATSIFMDIPFATADKEFEKASSIHLNAIRNLIYPRSIKILN